VVLTNIYVDKQQIILGQKSFLESLKIESNLITNNISNIDLSTLNEDVLRIDRKEIVSEVLTFTEDVYVGHEIDIPGTKLNGLNENFIRLVKDFTDGLYSFYETNILNPLRTFLEEITVAERLNMGRVETLEKHRYKPKYESSENFGQLATMELNEAEWGFSFTNNRDPDDTCALKTGCDCKGTIYTSSVSDPIENNHQAFIFTLERGVWTIISTSRSYSNSCKIAEEENRLIVNGLITDPVNQEWDDINLNVEQLGKINTEDINVKLEKDKKIGFITDIVMWDKRDLFLMAVSSYSDFNGGMQITILKFIDDWEILQTIHLREPMTKLFANLFYVDEFKQRVQLFVSPDRRGSSTDYLQVFQWNGTVFEQIQSIKSPGLSGMTKVSVKPTIYDGSHEVLITACKYGEHDEDAAYTILQTYTFDDNLQKYKSANIPEVMLPIGNEVVKLEMKSIAGYNFLFVALSQMVKVYQYTPLQGFSFRTEAHVRGVIDINLYEEKLTSKLGGPGRTVLVHITSKEDMDVKTTVLSVYVRGKMPYFVVGFPTYFEQSSGMIPISRIPVDGNWGTWSSFTPCSAAVCDGGSRVRTRECNSPAASNGGKPCKGIRREYERCNEVSCICYNGKNKTSPLFPSVSDTIDNVMIYRSFGANTEDALSKVVLVLGENRIGSLKAIVAASSNHSLDEIENFPIYSGFGSLTGISVISPFLAYRCVKTLSELKSLTYEQQREFLIGFIAINDADRREKLQILNDFELLKEAFKLQNLWTDDNGIAGSWSSWSSCSSTVCGEEGTETRSCSNPPPDDQDQRECVGENSRVCSPSCD